MEGECMRGLAVVAALIGTGCTKPTPPAARPTAVADPVAVAPVLVESENHSVLNEEQPTYWVKKLDETKWQGRAVRRLFQMFEDAVTRANRDLRAPEVKRFIDESVEPLTKLYVERYHLLDSKTRVDTIKLLAAYRDPRTEPALVKALEEFAKAPATNRDESDIKWAAQAQAVLRLESVAMPLFAAFTKLRVSSLLGAIAYRDVNEAMRKQPSRAWVAPLIAMLEPEMPKYDKKVRESLDQMRDQVFWQVTAAEALGRIGDPAAVEPLFKVLLDPAKEDISYTAGLALIKLRQSTTRVAIQLLKSEHEKLQNFHSSRVKKHTGAAPKGKPWVAIAAQVLGATGRREAILPLITVLEKTTDDGELVVLAEELTRIPGTPESKEAFKRAYRRVPLAAQAKLSEAAGRFLDPALVPWMLATAGSLKGAAADREAAQAALVYTALKLATPSELADVKAAADRFGAAHAKSLMGKIELLVQRCGEKGRCYLAALTNPENQSETNQFVGIKAGYMVGIFGNDELRDELVANFGSITNATLRHVAGQSIDHLTPNGSRAVAEALGAIIEANEKSPDRDKATLDSSLKQFMYRIAARAD
jgi:HEAT repeat protein